MGTILMKRKLEIEWVYTLKHNQGKFILLSMTKPQMWEMYGNLHKVSRSNSTVWIIWNVWIITGKLVRENKLFEGQ